MKRKLKIEDDPIFLTQDLSNMHDFEYTPHIELEDLTPTERKLTDGFDVPDIKLRGSKFTSYDKSFMAPSMRSKSKSEVLYFSQKRKPP